MASITVGLVGADPARLQEIASALAESSCGAQVAFSTTNRSDARRQTVSEKPDVLIILARGESCGTLDFLREIQRNWPIPVILLDQSAGKLAELRREACVSSVVAIGQAGGIPEGLYRAIEVAATKLRRWKQEVETEDAAPPTARRDHATELIAIASSTGGMQSLAQVFNGLPASLPPVVITQHIQPGYILRGAARMDTHFPHDIGVARDGEVLRRNQVRFAPDKFHLTVERGLSGPTVRLVEPSKTDHFVPAAEVMFASMVRDYGASVIAVILTGMGRDGAMAMRDLRDTGAYCIGEAESSCVVYGMPKAARDCGATEIEMPNTAIGKHIGDLVSSGVSA